MNGTARKITPGTNAATVTGIHTCCARRSAVSIKRRWVSLRMERASSETHLYKRGANIIEEKRRLIHVSGSDTDVIFRYLNGSYQLEVLNTSGIGYLNGFTWTPSPGWSVTGIKTSTGAACSVTPAGKISCAGTVRPPSCLCTGDGGSVSITFTAAATKKTHGYLFGGGPAQFKVTKMTPVPYLIPGTPEEAAKRDGV